MIREILTDVLATSAILFGISCTVFTLLVGYSLYVMVVCAICSAAVATVAEVKIQQLKHPEVTPCVN